ncbi:hypothetical protein BFW01_g9658 [Lasiodiplodia theobromae]|nr:hypothetical protein BFW01_g9658 [Lasiodiplodia theobromae]
MPLSLAHRRRSLGQLPNPPRAPINTTFATTLPAFNDNDSPSSLSPSSTQVATSASFFTALQGSNLSDDDMFGFDSPASLPSDDESDSEISSIDLFPTDVWSIAQRAATLGHRRYVALPATTSNSTVAARASHVHALVTQQLLPRSSLALINTPHALRVLVIWANTSRTLRSRSIMRGLFTSTLLAGTYSTRLVPARTWVTGETPVLSCSPAALLRCEKEILPLNPVIVFAEMPVPEEKEIAEEKTELGGDGDDQETVVESKKKDNGSQEGDVAELWHAVAGFAGSAGDERSRVYTFLDPSAEADRRAARRMREMMRLEGVEVPPLVAYMAEPVENEAADDDGDETDEDDGASGEDGGGVLLQHW